jgi:RNA polymerase sigma-70 factor (ECF subfamily)
MKTDAELMLAAADDADAFRDVYRRYAERIHSYLWRRCRDEDAAHELTAETFAQAWLVRRRFRDDAGGSAGPWLFGIARNVLLMSVRRRAVERRGRERLGLLVEPASTVAPDDTWCDGLDEALAELPADQRAALELRIVDDLAYVDVAHQLGTSPAAARVRVHRALTTLRHRFTDSQEVLS